MASPKEVTQLLLSWRKGNREALERLTPLVYDELRRRAARHLEQERPDHTLQPTALVHEAYLRLMGQRELEWRSRAHFFGVAAKLMRLILIDHARARRTAKRGGDATQVTLDDPMGAVRRREVDLLALDEALRRLAEKDPRQSRVVELRYFGGLSTKETAEILGVSPRTVKREWRLARAWLRLELSDELSRKHERSPACTLAAMRGDYGITC